MKSKKIQIKVYWCLDIDSYNYTIIVVDENLVVPIIGNILNPSIDKIEVLKDE